MVNKKKYYEISNDFVEIEKNVKIGVCESLEDVKNEIGFYRMKILDVVDRGVLDFGKFKMPVGGRLLSFYELDDLILGGDYTFSEYRAWDSMKFLFINQ